MHYINVFLYSSGIYIYASLIFLASFFHIKARYFRKGRKNIFQKLASSFENIQKPIIWIHSASLGEFEQGRPIIEQIKKVFPTHILLLTFSSPSGYEIVKNYKEVNKVYYLPIDTSRNAQKFLSIVQPKWVIFIKYEFWYFYIKRLKQLNIPIISVSTAFRKDQIYFKVYGNFYRRILKAISHFFVQNDQSIRLLKSIHINCVTLSGDTRFDRVIHISKERTDIGIVKDFVKRSKVLIIGSSSKKDAIFNAKTIKLLDIPLKVIIASHEVSLRSTYYLQKIFSYKPSILFSDALKKESINKEEVLIIDNIGILNKLYRYADIAFIGGGFHKNGLHNILEAAVYELPVVFGKHYQNFQEALDLKQIGGAFSVSNTKQWLSLLRTLLVDKNFRNQCGKTAKQYVSSNRGATDTIITYLKGKLKNNVPI